MSRNFKKKIGIFKALYDRLHKKQASEAKAQLKAKVTTENEIEMKKNACCINFWLFWAKNV